MSILASARDGGGIGEAQVKFIRVKDWATAMPGNTSLPHSLPNVSLRARGRCARS